MERLTGNTLKMYILNLPLNKEPFEVMYTGEKNREYRNRSFWLMSRLLKDGEPKEIDFVKFTNGYGKERPYFIAKFDYFHIAKINYKMEYSNGLKVNIRKGDVIIKLGRIIEIGNIGGIRQLNLNDLLN